MAEQSPWRPRVTVAAVIAQRGRFLLVEEMVDGRRVLNQPAGHLEDGEDLLTAVCREVREETCRTFAPTGLIGIYRWRLPDASDTYLRFCFTGSVAEPDPTQVRDADILGDLWLSMADIEHQRQRLRSPLVWQAIDDAVHGPLVPLDVLHDVED